MKPPSYPPPDNVVIKRLLDNLVDIVVERNKIIPPSPKKLPQPRCEWFQEKNMKEGGRLFTHETRTKP